MKHFRIEHFAKYFSSIFVILHKFNFEVMIHVKRFVSRV